MSARVPGRDRECERLDELLSAVRAGHSRALVIRGEPGIGKTRMLEYLADRAYGFRIARITGIQSEMELVFAGLHQLCAPLSSEPAVRARVRGGLAAAATFTARADDAPRRALDGRWQPPPLRKV